MFCGLPVGGGEKSEKKWEEEEEEEMSWLVYRTDYLQVAEEQRERD